MKKYILSSILIIFIISGYYFINDEFDNSTTRVVSYNGNNLKVSIDEEVSSTLPVSGNYYLVDYDCNNINTVVTWDNDTYTLSITNGNKKGSVSCNLEFKSNPLLSEMSEGSYVKYMGNNGCIGKSCEGQNANYVNDTDMGYCNDKNYKFHENGWRIGYIEDGSVYLISAGATDCVCTDSKGNSSSSCIDYITSSTDLSKHLNNMDSIALRYCNSNYAKDGICDSSTTWAMGSNDFEKIIGRNVKFSTCYNETSNISCGYTNDLIDNGSYYWIGESSNYSLDNVFAWNPYRYVYEYNSLNANGVRPVLLLDSSVVVIDGIGTYNDPYIIDIQETNIVDSSELTSNTVDLNEE